MRLCPEKHDLLGLSSPPKRLPVSRIEPVDLTGHAQSSLLYYLLGLCTFLSHCSLHLPVLSSDIHCLLGCRLSLDAKGISMKKAETMPGVYNLRPLVGVRDREERKKERARERKGEKERVRKGRRGRE